MTPKELAVILIGLFAGYWIVSKLLFRSPTSRGPGIANSGSLEPAWYEVLQVDRSASPEEIRAAYKQLIAKYHPDKVDTLGQELKDLANQKSQQIIAAYQAGMRANGQEP